MIKILLLLVTVFSVTLAPAQEIVGAWEATSTSEDGKELRTVAVFSDGFQAFTTYAARTGAFVKTHGGSWKLEDNTVRETVEFDTANPERVGSDVNYEIELNGDELSLGDHSMKFKRIDDGSPGKLQGAWLMSGRVRDGETRLRDTDGPRKTMKILSGTRFQWIAYNTETKQFMGTGGGTYTTDNGVYTESIEFFSRDDSKAGLSLKFDYEMEDGAWHHKGFSSKGDAMHEVWSRRD